MQKENSKYNDGFDQGFDKGFNAGYNIGYETGFTDAHGNRARQAKYMSSYDLLFKHLPSSIILGVNRGQLLTAIDEVIKNFACDTLPLKEIIKQICSALKKKQGYLITVASASSIKAMQKEHEAINEQMEQALQYASLVLVPSIVQYDDMFDVMSILQRMQLKANLAPLNSLSDLFRTSGIRDICNIAKQIDVYDTQADLICRYLHDNRITANQATDVSKAQLVLIGQTEARYRLMLQLFKAGKVVIDCLDIRTKLVNKILPVGINNYN